MSNIDKTSILKINRDLVICIFIVIATIAVYWQVRNHEFLNFDDPGYVTNNTFVKSGLTKESISWAFSSTRLSNWHPLTWLSHMLDCQLFSLDPGWHHITNLFFHIINSLLLFTIFKRITGDLWPSALVAVLFAIHPLHVESVAWVSERKDLLSTFFWMLTLWAYSRYVANPKITLYLPALLFFILGLMSKPMLVTLPFVLLLIDYWPLGRMTRKTKRGKYRAAPLTDKTHTVPVLHLVYEKIPFFVFAFASCLVTFFVQQKGGAIASLEKHPLNIRIAHALVSYIQYIKKMVWPDSLAAIYPHPGMPAGWELAGASLLLIFCSFLIIRSVKRYPYFAVGWFWFIGTLIPVIGLVQVGSQAIADRYTYVPYIGLFIILAWGLSVLLDNLRYKALFYASLATIILSIFMSITWLQVRYWNNTLILFKHALDVTTNNYIAHVNVANTLSIQGNHDEAVHHYAVIIQVNPDDADAQKGMGRSLAILGKPDKAVKYFKNALRINPDDADAHYSMGTALTEAGRLNEAATHFSDALRIDPDNALALAGLAFVLSQQDKIEEAIGHYSEALRIKPDNARIHVGLGMTLVTEGRITEGSRYLSEALRLAHSAGNKTLVKEIEKYLREYGYLDD